ncbi:hypothetical protein L6164_019220 [Bauhinia variegata]|uniref:Uncharacterized protein n=1 Tax=Bauhinia variegata TaxID=167791 RepID=A0ACB9NFC4_BAUVA|nr:hypothetical protein L6164_019220 [Bauhinia variegata]
MDNPNVPSDPYYAVNPTSQSSISTAEDSPLDESGFSSTVFRYISQMLVEEDIEEEPCTFHDSLSLQAAEKSLYQVIGGEYSCSTSQLELRNHRSVECPDDSLSANSSDYSSSGSCGSSTSSNCFSSHIDYTEYVPSVLQPDSPSKFVFQSSSQSSVNSNGSVSSSTNDCLDSTLLTKSESVFKFEKGMEEARKLLLKHNRFPFSIDLEDKTFPPSFSKTPHAVIKSESNHLPNELKESRKNHGRDQDETDLEEGRKNKLSAVYTDEGELSDLFDKVLLLGIGLGKDAPESRIRRQVMSYKKQFVDLRTLVILCGQAVSSDDRGTANELLRQIRQHSSPLGDGTQRLAHFFANALEARLAGAGTQIFSALSSKRTSGADMVKAYQMHISACPFEKLAIVFANRTIASASKQAETLHIIDFGIRYGFKWPALIHRLSRRAGGSPKLRITGIELPQPGFRAGEGVQETGRRLALYCERFKVPFEYNAIVAQKWENIQIKDLKLKKNEFIAVNCLVRFENLLDETVVPNSPKDAVLNLIRRINPDIFVHAILNGCYNAPFFETRFREAFYHYSSLFDMLDTNVAVEDPARLMFEKEFWGREITNVIACEGLERVERPETYKQWQVRNMRAGFRQLPLDHSLVNVLRGKSRDDYHSDFILHEDGNWMLQGWKGRVLYASSSWIPISD